MSSQVKAVDAYNAAADAYDDPANAFWEHFGRRTVERLGLTPGAHVLDVCCGSGASAIPAARAVGGNGRVIGVDLADKLLDLARRKAERHGLTNVQFRSGDMLNPGLPPSSFDAAICVFGIFFVPDMAAAVETLSQLVRPGGIIAITTWGPRFLEPLTTVFWDAVQQVRPDLDRRFRPWDRVSDPEAVRALFAGTDVASLDVEPEFGTHPLREPDDWWAMVLGTGYRATIEQLTIEDRASVREACLAHVRDARVTAVETNVVYAIATRAR